MSNPLVSRPVLFLVEDDHMVRETIRLLLEEEYEIVLADAVGSALAYLHAPHTRRIDVILLDCLLPGGRVLDVLAAADQRAVPVVLISGDPHQSEAVDPRRPFMSKPVAYATLLSVLDTARR